MIWLLAYLAAIPASLVALFWIAARAPLGWEDEHGFHLGEQEGE
jgi:hypothetical protein